MDEIYKKFENRLSFLLEDKVIRNQFYSIMYRDLIPDIYKIVATEIRKVDAINRNESRSSRDSADQRDLTGIDPVAQG